MNSQSSNQSRARVSPRRLEWQFLVFLGMAAALAGCAKAFKPLNYANPESLFRASMLDFEKTHWSNAQLGFEHLATDLSARDPLLAPAYYYLGLSHERHKHYLLAAQAYERVVDGFPTDTFAPIALLAAGRNYQALWRKPTLDPEYGHKALSTLRSLLTSYPDSKETAEAKSRIAALEEQFAMKDYLTGVHYVRVRGAIDPAIIYFKDVVTAYPETKAARMAWLRLHELYTKIRWKDDAAETCTTMWQAYPNDAEVKAACGEAPKDSTATQSKIPPPAVQIPAAFARPGPAR
jgi:outer membrane protein assembly factor BamD